jgi:hypothetical protein
MRHLTVAKCRFGSQATKSRCPLNVRFAPESDRLLRCREVTQWAMCGRYCYSCRTAGDGDEQLTLRWGGSTMVDLAIARLGGDEFAIIMTKMQKTNNAVTLARRIRESIIKPYQIEGHQIITDISWIE